MLVFFYIHRFKNGISFNVFTNFKFRIQNIIN